MQQQLWKTQFVINNLVNYTLKRITTKNEKKRADIGDE